jgi:hypothetical protein
MFDILTHTVRSLKVNITGSRYFHDSPFDLTTPGPLLSLSVRND